MNTFNRYHVDQCIHFFFPIKVNKSSIQIRNIFLLIKIGRVFSSGFGQTFALGHGNSLSRDTFKGNFD